MFTFLLLLLSAAAAPHCAAASQQVEVHFRTLRGPVKARYSPCRRAAVIDKGSHPCDSTQRLPDANTAHIHRSKRHVRCAGPMPDCASPLTEAHLDARRYPCSKTPASSSFKDWFKCGSRTRDTRFTRPLLYPSELTCGGMKQRIRAVRARATPFEAQARQVGWRTHCRCTIDVSTSSRDYASARPQILLSWHNQNLIAQNDETPVGSADRGLVRRCSGDCHLASPAT